MHTFFHSWRRKVGCVTLVMALGFVGFWFRSHFVQDAILYRSQFMTPTGRKTVGSFEASRNGLTWNHYEGLNLVPALSHIQRKPIPDELGPSRAILNSDEIMLKGYSQWYVFSFGELQNKIEIKMLFWLLSFWSIIIPLTVLSAYLLLVSSRKRPPKDPRLADINDRVRCLMMQNV